MHFSVLVLTKADNSPQASHKAAQALEVYDENLETEEHLMDCYCIGWAARKDAREEISNHPEQLLLEGLLERRRSIQQEVYQATNGEGSAYWDTESSLAMVTDPHTRNTLEQSNKDTEQQIQDVRRRLEQLTKEAEHRHPAYSQPRADCEVCSGTGMYFSTENPQGRWDWWTVGGRWTGLLSADYEPASDLRNYHPCDYCGQTGVRWWREDYDGMLRSAGHPDSKEDLEAPYDLISKVCNGCKGTGVARAFMNAPFDGDILPVSEIDCSDNLGRSLAALIDPQGNWHSSDHYDSEKWQKLLVDFLEQNQDCIAVLVDCHC